MTSGIDKTTQAAISAVVAEDEDLRRLIKLAAKKALSVQFDMMERGNPDQQLAAASRFNGVLVKAISQEEEKGQDTYELVRNMISNMLTPKRKSSGAA